MKTHCFCLLPVLALAACLIIIAAPLQAIVYQQWDTYSPGPEHRFRAPCGVGVDSSDNIYFVAPYFGPGWEWSEFSISKYTPGGTFLWRSRYHDPLNGHAWPNAMTVDPAGNVYATGDVQNWPNTDYITVKYNTQGQLEWAQRYSWQTNSDDRAQVITTDNQGNVYVSGHSHTEVYPGDYRFSTVKYNSQGIQQWVAQYHIPYYSMGGTVVGLAIDSQGNVILSGYCYITAVTHRDFVTIKYDSQGQQQWIAIYNGPASAEDGPTDLALDSSGNVYVTGGSTGLVNGDAVTIKYNPQGLEQWIARYDDPEHHGQYTNCLVLDTEGNVIVGGTQSPGSGAFLALKYTNDGLLIWQRIYFPTLTWEGIKALVVDEGNNIYVSGSGETTYGNSDDCLTMKLDPNGNVKWIGDNNFEDRWEGGMYLALDRQNDLVVCGAFAVPYDEAHPLLIKYDQVLGDLSAAMIPTTTPVEIPAQGGSFSYNLITLNTSAPNLSTDFWWKVQYPGIIQIPSLLAGPMTMSLPLDSLSMMRTQRVPGNAPAGMYQYILCAGDYPTTIWGTDTILVTKLTTGDGPLVAGSWSLVAGGEVRPLLRGVRGDLALVMASPNPFNPTTAISYELGAASYVSLKVYDTTGRLVATPVNGMRETGTHQVTFDGSGLASGVYLYNLTAGSNHATGKMLLMK